MTQPHKRITLTQQEISELARLAGRDRATQSRVLTALRNLLAAGSITPDSCLVVCKAVCPDYEIRQEKNGEYSIFKID